MHDNRVCIHSNDFQVEIYYEMKFIGFYCDCHEKHDCTLYIVCTTMNSHQVLCIDMLIMNASLILLLTNNESYYY